MNTIQTLTVYLGSSGNARPVFKQAAETLGRLIAENGKHLVYGGMDAGLMGILAAAALQHGAHVTGIIPQKIKDSERILKGLSETILVEELCDRKKDMFLRADAVISLPGGFGTLDESLELLYWADLGLHNKPLVLVNIEGYWDLIIKHLKTLPDFNHAFLIVVSTAEEAISALNNWTAPPIKNATPQHLPHFEDEITRKTNMPLVIDIATLENTYFAVCALGLKQLGKHKRPIGFVNTNGQFDSLLAWFDIAAQEHFITEKCLTLFDSAADESTLRDILKVQKSVHIDLHKDKWGA